MQELLLIAGATAALLLTSVLSYRCGHTDGWMNHLEQMVDNAEQALNESK